MLGEIIGDVHYAGRAAGGDHIDLGILNILDLVVVDLDRGVVVSDAVTTRRATAGVGILHLGELYTRDHFQQISRLIFNALAANHVTWIVVGHFVWQTSQFFLLELDVLFDELVDVKYLTGKLTQLGAVVDEYLDLFLQRHAARGTGNNDGVKLLFMEQFEVVLHKPPGALVITIGENRGAVTFLGFGDDNLVAVAGENIHNGLGDVSVNQVAGTAGEVTDAALLGASLRWIHLGQLALGALDCQLREVSTFGETEQWIEVTNRVLRAYAKEHLLGDTAKSATDGDRPFSPEQLTENKRLEEVETFLGGDIPPEAQHNVLGAYTSRAVGRAGLAVQTFIDGLFNPLGDLNITGDDFLGQFVFAPRHEKLIAEFLEDRAYTAAFTTLHTLLEFFGSFEEMVFRELFL